MFIQVEEYTLYITAVINKQKRVWKIVFLRTFILYNIK